MGLGHLPSWCLFSRSINCIITWWVRMWEFHWLPSSKGQIFIAQRVDFLAIPECGCRVVTTEQKCHRVSVKTPICAQVNSEIYQEIDIQESDGVHKKCLRHKISKCMWLSNIQSWLHCFAIQSQHDAQQGVEITKSQ